MLTARSSRRLQACASQFTGIEALESRRLMAVTFGVNSIVNPGAESNTGSSSGNDIITPTGWTRNHNATIVKYGASGFPSAASPGPSTRGANFFSGGPTGATPDLFQTIDLNSIGAAIDAHAVKFALSGYLGGFSSQLDQATLIVNFQNSAHGLISKSSVGPVTPANRGNITGLLLRSLGATTVPSGSRFAQVQIHFEALSGGYTDGYADNLSLIFTSTAPAPSISGNVFNDVNGDGTKNTGEPGLAAVKVFVDKNGNGTLDTGELNTTSAANGSYSFLNVPAGTVKVRQIVPASYRSTTTNPLAVTVVAGTTASGKNFGDSQTVLISGNVFNDANGNKIKDATETNVANAIVYLDFNNNGQLDSFELKTTTDSSGNYKFVVPFGTYLVRLILPAGKTLTTPTSSFSITLSKGLTSIGKNFGIK